MHRPLATANSVELTAVYHGEKPGTRRDQWAVHRIAVVAAPPETGLREGEEIEASGESRPYEFGSDDEPEFRSGCEYRFLGTLHEGKVFRGKKTPTIKFKSFLRCVPVSKQAVLRYLQEAPNIGPRIAVVLWETFGAEAVRKVREAPEAIAKLFHPGTRRPLLSLEYAQAAAVRLREMAALEHTTMEMMDLLAGYGLPKATAKKAIQKWGNRAAEVIKRNPLGTLMSFRGCGFLKADKVYQAQGLPMDALKRMTLCAWHYLSSDANGHTWMPRAKVMAELRLKVGGGSAAKKAPLLPQAGTGTAVHWSERPYTKHLVGPDDAVRIGIRAGLLAEHTDDAGTVWLAEGEKAREERKLAETILAAMEEPNPWQRVLEHPQLDEYLAPLSDHQKEQLLNALRGGAIAILGGGPGAGKTFVAACLIKLLIAIYGQGWIGATAFTGKAAQRLSEGMARYDIDLKAKTIHSLLKVKNFSDDSDDDEPSEFEFNEKNPLPFYVLNADEFSMNGVPLTLALLSARPRGCGVFIIGDICQLLPIEHGAPLRDFIAAGLPYGELTQIRRNAGQVVRLCKKLREGSRLSITDFCQFDRLQPDADDPTNCALVASSSPQAIRDEVVRVIKGVRDRFGYDPIWDVQVIVAKNTAGDLARVKFNELLQREFNPTAAVVPNCRFRVGDKLIGLKNAQYEMLTPSTWEKTDAKANVANGEFGQVLAVEEKRIVAKFFMPDRLVALPRVKEFVAKAGADGLREEGESTSGEPAGTEATETRTAALPFDLGLAVTCHKMQGSQAKCVVVVLDKSAYGLSCEWLLTALSRMEKAVVCVGEFGTASKMAGYRSLGERKTFLREAIEAGRLWGERVWGSSNMEVAAT